MKLGKTLYILAIVVLVGVFCVSAFYVGSYLMESQKQQTAYDELAGLMESIQNSRPPVVQTTPANPEQEDAPEESTVPTEPVILPEYLPLYEMNNHMVGWIKIELFVRVVVRLYRSSPHCIPHHSSWCCGCSSWSCA